MEYQKYIYWLETDPYEALKKGLVDTGLKVNEIKKAVCTPLARNIRIAAVLPGAWRNFDLCRRQMSWYEASCRSGQILVVSTDKINQNGIYPEVVIRKTNFRPSKLPGRDEKLKMIASDGYQKTKPAAWDDLASEPPGKHDKWMKVMGLRRITFEELFITHCANHSNFIEPAYYIPHEKGPVPYSIDKTKYICSACMELYNIIGAGFYKKLIVPCPGAVMYAGLPANQYLEVSRYEQKPAC